MKAAVRSRGAAGARITMGAICVVHLLACYSPPNPGMRFKDAVVITARDEQSSFAGFKTFFLRPEIRILDQGAGAVGVVADSAASPLLDATRKNLVERGYGAVDSKDGADLAVDLSYLRSVTSSDYCYDWYDWWDWAYWGFYYAYPSAACDTSAWRSEMLITNIADLESVEPSPGVSPGASALASANAGADAGAPLEQHVANAAELRLGVWISGVYGVDLDSASAAQPALAGIDQAFAQSSYLTAQP